MELVYLTCVGGGAFGNCSLWIANAMEMALTRFKKYPLDVFLVHYMRNVTQATNPFVKIEHKFGGKKKKGRKKLNPKASSKKMKNNLR